MEKLIVTNAAGGVDVEFEPGELMIIADHINNMGTSPLIGPNDQDLGERFLDMSKPYSECLIKLAHSVAEEQHFNLREGVYMANL